MPEDSRATVVGVQSYSAVRRAFFRCLVIDLSPSLEGSSGLFEALLVKKFEGASLSASDAGNGVSEAPSSSWLPEKGAEADNAAVEAWFLGRS